MVNKREEIKKAYKNPLWAQRVDKMTEEQVTAIYLKLRSKGKI